MTEEIQTENSKIIQNILNGGDLEAQNHLYEICKNNIEAYLKYKYPKYIDYDDDVSEIITKIFDNLNLFDQNRSNLKTWIISITNNHIIDKWRDNKISSIKQNKKNNQTISEDINETFFSSSSTTQTNKNIDFETKDLVNYLYSQISYPDCELLDMKYVQGYTHEEIGNKFNLSSATISNRINYIKSKLKKNNKDLLK
jgi:RNA polymerase sigma factor (sigma-70 family)